MTISKQSMGIGTASKCRHLSSSWQEETSKAIAAVSCRPILALGQLSVGEVVLLKWTRTVGVINRSFWVWVYGNKLFFSVLSGQNKNKKSTSQILQLLNFREHFIQIGYFPYVFYTVHMHVSCLYSYQRFT